MVCFKPTKVNFDMLKPQSDARYEDEVSGCTASVGIISREKIWVVRSIAQAAGDVGLLA